MEFVVRACGGESLSSLCREFAITRPTGYLWLKRFREQGVAGVREHSRRPQRSPRRTAEMIEARIVELRLQRPGWGARKLAVLLQRVGIEGGFNAHRQLSPQNRKRCTWALNLPSLV
jgi:transposase